MKVEVEGDTYFPKIDNNIWEIDEEKEYNDFKLKIYHKKETTD